jgi:hypothetical protein
VPPEASALLKAKAAAELKKIAPTVAATDNASRGYLVTREEGRRMVELFHDIDDAETIEYKAGLLVRVHDADGGQLREWYFEFRDDAHANASAATRAPATDDAHGLPAPNVATVEIYGYLGAKEINGRKLADMSPEEVEAVKTEANEESPLLLAGHVAVSFDGGKTLYGFTPKPDPSLSVEEVIDMLKAGAVFPGQVQIDTKHYEIAAKKAAEQGWKIEQKRVVVTFDPAESNPRWRGVPPTRWPPASATNTRTATSSHRGISRPRAIPSPPTVNRSQASASATARPGRNSSVSRCPSRAGA